MIEMYLLVCFVFVLTALQNVPVYSQTTFPIAQIIQANGFPVETHTVTTTDGYILEMHRIPHGRTGGDGSTKRPVVFLMHGLGGASNQYIMLGANYSFAYNLADEGFDVWMGNARGNLFSRKHITLDPNDNVQKFQFFNFTFEEIATHDLPAMIDYALQKTGSSKIHYIGHSQGGTVFLVLTSLLPQFNDKFASVNLLAGVGYQKYFPDESLLKLAVDVDAIYALALVMGIVEMYPTSNDVSRMTDQCTGDSNLRYMCDLSEVRQILRNTSPDVQTYVPVGTSLKQVAHYGQNIRDKLFRRYHFGAEKNQLQYGVAEPPLYNLGLISCKVTMHYSLNDTLLDERDVLDMVKDMPNAQARKVARDSFDHSDYVTALDAKELVTDFIINAIKESSASSSPGAASTSSLNTYVTFGTLIIIFLNLRKH